MQNSKILEMLDKGQTEELKSLLQDEIYANSLRVIQVLRNVMQL